MGIAILFAVFGVLLLIGVPVAYALAAAALATLFYLDLPSVVLVQQISAAAMSATTSMRGAISPSSAGLMPRGRHGWRRCPRAGSGQGW